MPDSVTAAKIAARATIAAALIAAVPFSQWMAGAGNALFGTCVSEEELKAANEKLSTASQKIADLEAQLAAMSAQSRMPPAKPPVPMTAEVKLTVGSQYRFKPGAFDLSYVAYTTDHYGISVDTQVMGFDLNEPKTVIGNNGRNCELTVTKASRESVTLIGDCSK